MNMQKYAQNVQKICRNMHLICTLYAIKYARNMQEYARICIGAYLAFFAYICTPHFADERGGSQNAKRGEAARGAAAWAGGPRVGSDPCVLRGGGRRLKGGQ
jgi:hypothetical protein